MIQSRRAWSGGIGPRFEKAQWAEFLHLRLEQGNWGYNPALDYWLLWNTINRVLINDEHLFLTVPIPGSKTPADLMSGHGMSPGSHPNFPWGRSQGVLPASPLWASFISRYHIALGTRSSPTTWWDVQMSGPQQSHSDMRLSLEINTAPLSDTAAGFVSIPLTRYGFNLWVIHTCENWRVRVYPPPTFLLLSNAVNQWPPSLLGFNFTFLHENWQMTFEMFESVESMESMDILHMDDENYSNWRWGNWPGNPRPSICRFEACTPIPWATWRDTPVSCLQAGLCSSEFSWGPRKSQPLYSLFWAERPTHRQLTTGLMRIIGGSTFISFLSIFSCVTPQTVESTETENIPWMNGQENR